MGASIGEQIINRRKSLGWSASELARRAGVCRSTVWHIESGKYTAPTLKTLHRLEAALEITLEPAFHSRNAVSPFGKRIRKRRQELGLTQREAAKLAGIRRSTLQNIEFGRARSCDETIRKICRALNVELDMTDMTFDETVSPLGREVRRRRLELGMSTQDLAAAVGAARSAIANLEHGRTKSLCERYLYRLKKVLQMDPEPDSGEELSVGAAIRKTRVETGLSRVKLASLAGIPVSRLESYEENKVKRIPAPALAAIMNALLTLENDAIHSMPDELWEQLRSMEQQNMLSKEAAERLCTLSKQSKKPAP